MPSVIESGSAATSRSGVARSSDGIAMKYAKDTNHSSAPLYGGALAFFLGVALYSLYDFGFALPTLLILLGAILIFVELFTERKLHSLFLFLVLGGVALGMVRVVLFERNIENDLIVFASQNITLAGTIVRDPEMRERTLHAVVG